MVRYGYILVIGRVGGAMQYTDSGGGWESVALTTYLLLADQNSVKIFQKIVEY